MSAILNRIFEPSTWAGLGVLASAAAQVFEPGVSGSGSWTSLLPAAVAAVIAIVVPEKKAS